MRVHWNADRIIRRNGWNTLWYQAVSVGEERSDGAADWTLREDGDRGCLYEPPKTIKVLFTSINQQQRFDPAGAFTQGQANATIRVRREVGLNDRLVPQVFYFRDDFVLPRGSGVSDVVRDRWLNEVLILRTREVKYIEGTDFQLNKNKITGTCEIEWLEGGQSPATGVSYSVQAMISPVWVVNSHGMIRALKGRQLPWKFELKRDDMAVRV